MDRISPPGSIIFVDRSDKRLVTGGFYVIDDGHGNSTYKRFQAQPRMRFEPVSKNKDLPERENSVVVHIAHAPLASPEDTVMAYLETHDEITNSIGRDLTSIRSENTMKEVFYRLAKRHLIERVPDKLGSASAWRKFTGTGGKATINTPDVLSAIVDDPATGGE